MRLFMVFLAAAATLGSSFAACGDDEANPTAEVDSGDGTVGDTDAPDVATPPDTIVADEDSVAGDAVGDTLATPDAAEAPDTVEAPDADGPDADGPDADAVAPDAPDATDAHTADVPPDPPPGPNVIANGSFELWTDGRPEGWLGAESNLSSDAVTEVTSVSHDGVRSARLANTSDTHRRFTTAAMSLGAGAYRCRYWVRGEGEIRNARYDGGFSSYSGYDVVDTDIWTPITYDFNVASDVAEVFELIFSVRNTDGADHLLIDDVTCWREPEPCDAVSCQAWEVCVDATAACVPAPGMCGDAGDCAEWQACDLDNVCVLAPGRCEAVADCDAPTPVCDLDTHLCVAGDPCADVSCQPWQQCDPTDASCVLSPGSCTTTADCAGDLPVCDVAAHACVPIDAPANVVPNGGFETWSDYSVGGASTWHLPDSWYGVCDGCTPYFPTTEIAPAGVLPYTASVHGGATACQLVAPGTPADRFVTDPFTVTPGAVYTCGYWARGRGSVRHRGYCGGWNPDTDFLHLDTEEWTQVTFELSGQASWCVLIFYAGGTEAAGEHLQLDDVSCTRKSP